MRTARSAPRARFLSPLWSRLIAPLLLATIACALMLLDRHRHLPSKLMMWAGVSAVLLLVVLVRLRYRNSGAVLATALFLTGQLVVIELLPGCPIACIGGLKELPPFVLPLLIGALAIEAFLRLANPPEWRWTPLTLREAAFILLQAGVCFVTLASFSLTNHGFFAAPLATLFLSMTVLFSRFLVDRFGTVLSILFLLSIPTAFLNTRLLTNELFRTQTIAEIVSIGWIVGIAVEAGLAVSGLKNVLYAFKAGRPGQVNSAFVQSSGHLSKALTFSLIAPLLTILVAVDGTTGSELLATFWFATTFAALGGILAALASRDINSWGLVGLLRSTFQQVWSREFDSWVCCCAVGDIDDDGINEVIVGCADHSIYCLRNGSLVWRTPIGNPPSSSCAIGYVGAHDQKKFVTGCGDNKIYCLSPSGEILWEVETPRWVWCCTLGDADNDGENEVIAGGMDDKIHCYGDEGEELWSMYFDSWVGCCAVGDADNDGSNEVVAGSNDHTLRCLKDGPNEIWRAWFGEWVTAVDIGDVDNDGLNEVVAGSNDGTLRCYRNGVEIWRASILGTVSTLVIGDVDGDGVNEIVVGCGDNTIRVYKYGKEVWVARLEKYPDCVTIGDFNNDGQNEILSGDWYSYLRAFKSTELMQVAKPVKKQ